MSEPNPPGRTGHIHSQHAPPQGKIPNSGQTTGSSETNGDNVPSQNEQNIAASNAALLGNQEEELNDDDRYIINKLLTYSLPLIEERAQATLADPSVPSQLIPEGIHAWIQKYAATKLVWKNMHTSYYAAEKAHKDYLARQRAPSTTGGQQKSSAGTSATPAPTLKPTPAAEHKNWPATQESPKPQPQSLPNADDQHRWDPARLPDCRTRAHAIMDTLDEMLGFLEGLSTDRGFQQGLQQFQDVRARWEHMLLPRVHNAVNVHELAMGRRSSLQARSQTK